MRIARRHDSERACAPDKRRGEFRKSRNDNWAPSAVRFQKKTRVESRREGATVWKSKDIHLLKRFRYFDEPFDANAAGKHAGRRPPGELPTLSVARQRQ